MDVITMGETMVLFTPQLSGRIANAQLFKKSFAGAESNVMIGLSRLGYETGWISKVGSDELGKALLTFIKGEGIDVSQVRVDAHSSTGMFFKESYGKDQIKVEYFRKNSAASQLAPGDVNEDYIKQAKYLHLTGITPALSDTCYQTVKKAIELAKKHHVTIIFDPNLRKKLWDGEKAKSILKELSGLADIVLPGIEEAEFIFGSKPHEELCEDFIHNGSALVVMKLGSKGAYYCTALERGFVPSFHMDKVIDPIGAGDGFAAGFIAGLLEGEELAVAVQKGNAVGAIVTQFTDDFEGLPTKEELNQFIQQVRYADVIR